MGGFLIFLGFVIMGIALVGVIRGHVSWARIPTRKLAAGVLAAGVVVMGAGGALTPKPAVAVASADTAATSSSTATSTPAAKATAAAVAAQSPEQLCAARPWPLPAPSLVSTLLEKARTIDLACLSLDTAIAPDGHNVLTDASLADWVITQQNPPAGQPVSAGTRFSVTVVSRASSTAAPTPLPTSSTAAPTQVYVPPTSVYVPAPAPQTQQPAPAPQTTQQSSGGSSSGSSSCGDDSYVNSAGNCVQRPTSASSAPPGATARCGDGTYSFSQSRRGTCSSHGGVAEWL